MKNELTNKKLILITFLVVLFSVSSAFAQIDQTNQKNGASISKAIDTGSYDKEIEPAAQWLNEEPRKTATTGLPALPHK